MIPNKSISHVASAAHHNRLSNVSGIAHPLKYYLEIRRVLPNRAGATSPPKSGKIPIRRAANRIRAARLSCQRYPDWQDRNPLLGLQDFHLRSGAVPHFSEASAEIFEVEQANMVGMITPSFDCRFKDISTTKFRMTLALLMAARCEPIHRLRQFARSDAIG